MHEAQVDDARLALATALAAADAGAVVANHARVTSIEFVGDEAHLAIWGPEGGTLVRARSVVNASGPWLDAVRRLEDPAASPIARLSKGVHLALAVEEPWQASLSVHLDDEHNLFAEPWHGMLLVGVTDTPYDDDAAGLTVTDADVDLLLGLQARVLPAHLLRRERIRARSAGLRVLPRGEGSTATARRDNVVAVGRGGMVSIGGGKLTTHRLEAMDALGRLPPRVRPRRRPPSRKTIVGLGSAAASGGAPSEVAAHLAATYGDGVGAVLAHGRSGSAAFERIHPDGPDVWAQVRHAIASELAMTVDDVTHRRTSLWWRGLDDEPTKERIARALLPTPVRT